MPYKNVEQAQEYHRQYRATHRKELRERSRKWYWEHKGERATNPKSIEEKREYQRQWRAAHKEQSQGYVNKWAYTHREEIRVKDRAYRAAHKEKIRDYARNYARKYRQVWRDKVLDLLGHQCARCGYTGKAALQIDHINGGGVREIRALGSTLAMYKRVIKQRGIGYQTLCANCNWEKRAQNGEDTTGRRKD